MKRVIIYFSVILLIAVGIIVFKGDYGSTEIIDISNYLPGTIESNGMERTADVTTFKGIDLCDYINGAADIYFPYNFIEVANTYYKHGDMEIIADIYIFDNLINAYGLYTMLRPEHPDYVPFGIEGFTYGTSTEFVKGNLLVRVTGYDESSETVTAINKMAGTLNSLVPGKCEKPEAFSLFPKINSIKAADKYYADSFLGHRFLTSVYSQSYLFADDTLTLFFMDDEAGDRFTQWMNLAKNENRILSAIDDLPYESGEAIRVNNSYYGEIIGGLVKGKIAGIINYNNIYKTFVSDWLKSL